MKIIRSKKFVIRGGASNRALTYLTEMTTYKNLSIKSSSRREEISFDRITARTFYSSGVSPRSVRSLDCPLINTLVVNDSRRTGQASCNDALTPFKPLPDSIRRRLCKISSRGSLRATYFSSSRPFSCFESKNLERIHRFIDAIVLG